MATGNRTFKSEQLPVGYFTDSIGYAVPFQVDTISLLLNIFDNRKAKMAALNQRLNRDFRICAMPTNNVKL
jgi:hypothetical protein